MHPAKQVKVGDIVNYRIASWDAQAINSKPGRVGNHVNPGDIYPMIVVRVWEPEMVNGQIFLDGPDTFWATSRHYGIRDSEWCWPGGAPEEE